MTTCYWQHTCYDNTRNHATFWSSGHVIIKVQSLLKGQSQKIQIFLKLIETQIYLHFQMSYATKLVGIGTTCYHPCKHATFWSFGYVIIKVQNLLKGQSHKIQIFLKLIEAQIYLNIQSGMTINFQIYLIFQKWYDN